MTDRAERIKEEEDVSPCGISYDAVLVQSQALHKTDKYDYSSSLLLTVLENVST